MAKYRFDEHVQSAFEHSVVPIGIYQLVDGRVVTLVVSDGLCELFGYKDRTEAVEKMDGDMYWNVHPDDVARVVEVAEAFISKDEPYNLVCRIMKGNEHRLIHTRGKHVITETGERIAVVWYIDEGAAVLEAKAAEDAERIEELESSMQEALSASALYESIVNALSMDYFDLYYVNVETGEYVEYGSRTEKGPRAAENHGRNFFEECKENALVYIYEEDRERFVAALSKDNLLGKIEKHGAYLFNYRLVIDGVPTYVSLKATRITGDNEHVIIGVSNVDTQVKDRMAAERAIEDQRSYVRLSALTGNLIVLYYIDPETNQYTEFSSSRTYEGLGLAKQGLDFFEDANKNSLRTIHPEDQALFHSHFTKENILATIERDGIFSLDYRMLGRKLPTYVRLKAAMVEEDGKAFLIVGLLDEDAQIRQEQEYARNLSIAQKMATIDSLTGIKNKHAYAQWEERINGEIETGVQEPFAVAVCDINGLKAVNDSLGHKEGDSCIKKACAKICKVFSHSPVFRVGGDEFVVLLTREDFYRRQELLEQINAIPKNRSGIKAGETVSAGMADYDKKRHTSLQSVLEEADRAMYERKQFLKSSDVAEESNPSVIQKPNSNPEYLPVVATQKHILIVDDIYTNREIMGDLLEGEYEISYASDGAEALETLRDNKGDIDLVILDLLMPNKDGREVLAEMQVDEQLMSVPVIVLTVDQAAELDCLKIGAMDFIPKPFPDVEIVKARIDKCIELAEDRDLIRHTERDRLTGLLNKDYFFRYVSRLDHIHRGTSLDAVVCDVNRFYATNKQFGRQFGDLVLRRIGICTRNLARKIGGIGCRQGMDTFLLYCPHRDDYEELLEEFKSEVLAEKEIADKVSMRFGVFANAQIEEDIEERFVRAKIAADRVKDDPRKAFGLYDLD